MQWQKSKSLFRKLLRFSFSDRHNRIVACGLLVGLCYSPFWIANLVQDTLSGSASLLMAALTVLGCYLLWSDRQQLATLRVSLEDRSIGHCIIISGVLLAPFCAFSEWSQKLLWMLILGGIGLSCGGVAFFRRYPIPIFLITVGLLPQPKTIGRAIWEAFTPPQLLEHLMAWAGATGLRALGQPAELDGVFITLPSGSVEVAWGCNGFDMATTVAVTSLLLGLFLKQPLSKVLLIVSTGVLLALLFNIPRVMLMTLANVYWGKAAFEFWHGFWGGQVFSAILFTIQYYVILAFLKPQARSSS